MGNVKVVEALLAHKDIELNLQCKKVLCTSTSISVILVVPFCILGSVETATHSHNICELLISLVQDRATPLMKAARGGYEKIVDLLLKHQGIAVNVQDKVLYHFLIFYLKFYLSFICGQRQVAVQLCLSKNTSFLNCPYISFFRFGRTTKRL